MARSVNEHASTSCGTRPWQARRNKKLMGHRSHVLDAPGRQIVLRAIQEVCARARMLIAAHVRTTHVHVVVEAHSLPEAVVHEFTILKPSVKKLASNELVSE